MHLLLIRHFRTDSDNKIDYVNSPKEAEPYIHFIIEYIKSNNIELVEIFSSPQDRTFLTSIILSNILKDSKDLNKIQINYPLINKMIDRDPSKERVEDTQKYFKKILKNNNFYIKNKLVIYITHSSIYYNIFKSIIDLLSGNNKLDIKQRIHRNSLSWIRFIDKKLKYNFNIQMNKSKK